MTEKDLVEWAYKIAMRIVCLLVGHEDWRTEILPDGSAVGYGSELCFRCNKRLTKHARRRGDSHRFWEDTPGQFEPGDEDLFKPTSRG